MSKTRTVNKRKQEWTLRDGVGFEPCPESHKCEWHPAPHCVVLMQSMHSGTQVIGPFTSEDAAHKWVREEADSELYQRFDRASVPGVSFHVEYLDIPTKRGA